MPSYSVETILRIRDNATRKLEKFAGTLEKLQKQVDGLTASMTATEEAATALAEAMTTAAAASRTAATEARTAARGFSSTARAATRAADSVERYNLAAAASIGAVGGAFVGGAAGTASSATQRAAANTAAKAAAAIVPAGAAQNWRFGQYSPSNLAVPTSPFNYAFHRASGGGASGGFGGSGNLGGYGPATGGGGIGDYSPLHRVAGAVKFAATAGVGLATDALYEAGKLQQKLTLIQVATGASNAQINRIRQLAYNVSDMTAQSVSQSAGVIGVMASSGINDPEKLLKKDPKTGKSFAEIVAKFADVQYLKSGVPFEEGAKQAIQLAHLYRNYSPQAIAPMLDDVTKLSFMMPDTINRYLTQAGYYVPLLSKLGVPQEQSLVMGAFLDRMGLGRGKGGTAIQNFTQAIMKPLEMTGHQQKGQLGALEALNIYDKNGHENSRIFRTGPGGHSVIDIFAALQAVQKSIDDQTNKLTGSKRAHKERELIGDFQKAFGIQGQRFGLLGDDKGIQQLLQMVARMKSMPGVEAGQSLFMKNFDSQTVRAWSNFQSLMTEIGSQALPGMTKGALDLGDALHNAQGWLHQHAGLERSIQRTITSGVVATERYLVGHKSDWITFGNDIKYVGKEAIKAAPDLFRIGDAIGKLYQQAKMFGDDLNGLNDAVSGNAKWLHDVAFGGSQERQDAILAKLHSQYGPAEKLKGGGFDGPLVKVDVHGRPTPAQVGSAASKAYASAINDGQHTLRQSGSSSSGSTKVPRHMTTPSYGGW